MRLLRLGFCLTISAACMIFLFRKVNVIEVMRILSHINYFWLFIATLIGVSKAWVTAFRWIYLALPCGRLSAIRSFYYYSIGTMTNMTLPFRVGDLVRARMVSEAAKIPNAMVLGTIASEHILDLLVLCGLLTGCFAFYSYRWPSQLVPNVILFCIIISIVFLGLFVLNKNSRSANFINKLIHQILPRKLLVLLDMIANFYSGFFQLGGVLNIAKIVALTACIWAAQAVWIFSLLNSLGLVNSYHLGIEAVSVLIVMMGVAVMIPASPGYIGTFHLMVVLGLVQMGVPRTTALSCAILVHAHALIVAIATGMFSLWKVNFIPSKYFSLTKKVSLVQEEG